MTLVSSAFRNDLDVWRYVKDVLEQLLAGQTNYKPLRMSTLGHLTVPVGAYSQLSSLALVTSQIKNQVSDVLDGRLFLKAVGHH